MIYTSWDEAFRQIGTCFGVYFSSDSNCRIFRAKKIRKPLSPRPRTRTFFLLASANLCVLQTNSSLDKAWEEESSGTLPADLLFFFEDSLDGNQSSSSSFRQVMLRIFNVFPLFFKPLRIENTFIKSMVKKGVNMMKRISSTIPFRFGLYCLSVPQFCAATWLGFDRSGKGR